MGENKSMAERLKAAAERKAAARRLQVQAAMADRKYVAEMNKKARAEQKKKQAGN